MDAAKFNCELLDLRAFVAIHETRNFNKAAQFLNMSQPALSRRIQRLEAVIGGPLFDRTSRTLAETALGKELIPVARQTLEQLDGSLFAAPSLREQRWTEITIFCVQTAAHVLAPAARRLMQDNPRLRLRILEVPSVEGMDLVSRGEAEFGITIESLLTPGLRFESLHEDPFGLVCHKDHPFAQKTTIQWSDLRGESLIATYMAGRTRTLLELQLGQHGITLDWRYKVGHVTAALSLIEAEVGVAVVPRMCLPPHGRSEIVWRPLVGPEVRRTIGILQRRSGSIHPAALQLLDEIRKNWPATVA